MPSMSMGSDPESLARFDRAIRDGCLHQARLALELLRKHPEHERVTDLMDTRWLMLCNALHMHGAVDREVARFLGGATRTDLRAVAGCARAHARLGPEGRALLHL